MSRESDQRDEPAWAEAVGVAASLTLLLSLALVAAGGWSWFKTLLESAAPAWIQAVGSVAAIIAAAAIARQQASSARRLEAEKQAAAEVQKLKIVLALMARAHGLSNDICRAFETAKFEDFDQVSPELMADTHQTLMALPIFEVPDGLLALDVLTIGRALGVLHDRWLNLREACSSDPSAIRGGVAELGTLADEVREISLDAVHKCRSEIASRGGKIADPSFQRTAPGGL